jgi:hypothetical protein
MKFTWFDTYINGKYFKQASILLSIIIDKKKYYLQLDTGTKTSIIYGKFLENKNISFKTTEPTPILFTLNSIVSTHYFRVDTETELTEFKGIPMIGLLGLDFIKQGGILSIDFPNQRISFSENFFSKIKLSFLTIPIKSQEGFLVFTSIINKKEYVFMWDSGASIIDLFITSELWEKLTLTSIHSKSNQIVSLSGAFGSTHMLFKEKINYPFLLFGKQMKNKNAYCNKFYSPLTDIAKVGIDGLIGNTLFIKKIISIDFNTNEMCYSK